MNPIAKLALTVATLFYGCMPVLIDVSSSHLLHPEWSPHSRFHLVWLLSVGFTTTCLALWLLWIRRDSLVPGVLGLLYTGGFFVAAATRSLYGGAFTEPGGVESTLFGLDVGIFAFGGAFVVIAASQYFLARDSGRA